jgi:DnaJ-class molecular chaperone
MLNRIFIKQFNSTNLIIIKRRFKSKSGKNYYDLLNLKQNAKQSEIKTAYIQKSKLLHPDTNKSENANQEFRELKEAYDTLSNVETRSAYDNKIDDGSSFENLIKQRKWTPGYAMHCN